MFIYVYCTINTLLCIVFMCIGCIEREREARGRRSPFSANQDAPSNVTQRDVLLLLCVFACLCLCVCIVIDCVIDYSLCLFVLSIYSISGYFIHVPQHDVTRRKAARHRLIPACCASSVSFVIFIFSVAFVLFRGLAVFCCLLYDVLIQGTRCEARRCDESQREK